MRLILSYLGDERFALWAIFLVSYSLYDVDGYGYGGITKSKFIAQA